MSSRAIIRSHIRKSLWQATMLLVGMLATSSIAQTCTQQPSDPQANDNAKAMLCYFNTHTYISGQTDMFDADSIYKLTGRYPALVAFDFYGYTDGDANANAQNDQAAINFSKQRHGLVAFQWHWKAPAPSGRGEYYTQWDFVSAMNDTTSQLYKDMDLIANHLKILGDSGVPILFRPLHESNGNFMWWTLQGSAAYKRLWQILYQRISAKGVHNIIWVFNGMASGQGTPMSQWYPGDNLVDVISSDYYQSQSDYNTLKAIGSNKTLGVSETWLELNPASDPPFSFSVVWAHRDWAGSGPGATGVVNAWKTAMSNAKTISLDQIPLLAPTANPRISKQPKNLRMSNTQLFVLGAIDLSQVFQDTLKLTYTVATSGSASVSAKLNGGKVDIGAQVGDTGTTMVLLTATNSLNLSTTASFIVYLKDYHHGNLALHQPGFASSGDASAPDPNAIFDGDSTTRWSSAYTDHEWLMVDLDSVLPLDSLRLLWQTAYGSQYQILTSIDSTTWDTVYTQKLGQGGVEAFHFSTVQARFVWLQGLARATQWGYSLYELQVYGSAPTLLPSNVNNGLYDAGERLKLIGTNLMVDAPTGGWLRIVDMKGQTTLLQYVQGSQRVSLSHLRAGIYEALLQKNAQSLRKELCIP